MLKKKLMAVVLSIAMVLTTIMGCTKSAPVSEKSNTEKTTSKETKDKSAQKQSKKADQQVTAKETKKEDKDVTEKTNDSKTASADTKQTSKKTAEDKKADTSENKSDKKTDSGSKPAAGNSSKPADNKPTTGNTSGSKPGSESSSNAPAHQHNFQPVPKVVHHDATGHNEPYVVQEAWDETVIIGTEIIGDWACCNVCGENITGIINEHQKAHALAGEGGGWHTEYYERDITDVIHHEAVYGTRWVKDSEAWDETVIDGYKCSCGATK